MLFGYPIAATNENWLHDCLCEMVREIHVSLTAGHNPPEWLGSIPAVHREQLRRRTGIRNRLDGYWRAGADLSNEERGQVLTCMDQQNRINALCSCATDCEELSQLPQTIQEHIEDLFDYAFSLLTELGVRDRQYETIYSATTYHVCPFCGCEYFDAPGAPREDMDHYLPKSLYPFAAANLRNLVPMGMRCNERFKLDQDILRNAVGVRRMVFDPYLDRNIEVRLTDSVPFAAEDGQTPDWVIEFQPDSPECETWDEVFSMRERIKRDVLDQSFRRWLREFATWFKRRIGNPAPDKALVLNAVDAYSEDMADLGLNAREFLRAPVFRMLHHHCANGDDRLSDFMIDLVSVEGAG